MKLGIIGLPSSGKTTIFNALTKGDAPTGQSMGGRFDLLTAVVDVYDERVDVLTSMFNPKKTAFAKITYTDIAGIKKGANEGGGMSGELLNHLSGLDGFVHVVRAFESDLVPHADGSVDAARDLEILDTELLLNDLSVVERRIEKIKDGLRKGATKNKAAAQAELTLFEQLDEALSEERPLRGLSLTEEQEKMVRGYGLLTLKPTVVLLNIGDEQ
ncbi:GTP-binding and nucleic acid-binding protein YchF, partial [hydrothermal vent metagenome]